MNLLNKKILALKLARRIYLQVRKDPEHYAKNYRYENKGEIYLDWHKNHYNRLNRFYNIHKGQDCFIIGNGPSLNDIDIEQLNKFYTFGLNKIYLIFKRIPLKINYHVSVNSLVLEQSIKEILNLNIPSFLSINNINSIIENENLYYLYTKGDINAFNRTITEPINESGTVTYIAMQIAYYMGFKNVFLVGVDHNFKQSGEANTEQLMEGEDPNHFDPSYFSGKKWNLADLDSSEYGYKLAKLAFERDNRKIIDATHNGKLTVFEKIGYEAALKKCKPK